MEGVPDMATILSLLDLIDMLPSAVSPPDHKKNVPDHSCISDGGQSELALSSTGSLEGGNFRMQAWAISFLSGHFQT